MVVERNAIPVALPQSGGDQASAPVWTSGRLGSASNMAGFQVTEVQKALKGADYPMEGAQLAELAEKNGADPELVDALRGLREVGGPNGVMKELKGELGGATDDDD